MTRFREALELLILHPGRRRDFIDPPDLDEAHADSYEVPAHPGNLLDRGRALVARQQGHGAGPLVHVPYVQEPVVDDAESGEELALAIKCYGLDAEAVL